MIRVPDIGETFKHISFGRTYGYRVTSWLMPLRVFEVSPEGVARDTSRREPVSEIEFIAAKISAQFPPRGFTKDNIPLRFCLRQEATHVGGTGVGGIILPVRDIIVDGVVPWPEEHLAEQRRLAVKVAGQCLR